MSKNLLCDDYRWPGQNVPPVTGSPDSQPWRSKLTKTGGSPTVAAAGGAMVLTLDDTDEVQAATLYMGDVLGYSLPKLVRVDFWASVTAGLVAAVNAAFGLCSAEDNAPESAAEFLFFRLVGSNELLISTFDGTNLTSQIDTGIVLGTTPTRCSIDLGSGLVSTAGQQATGGAANALFAVEQVAMPNSPNPTGVLRRVCTGTRFNCSAYTGKLQPLAQIIKTANVAAPALTIHRVRLEFKADYTG